VPEPGPELDAIRRSLAATGTTVRVEWVDETGSTNSDLAERLRASKGPLPTTLRVAARQTAGRGRHGRRWHGAAGASLTFSLCRPLVVADPSGLSLAVGVALAEAIEPAADGALIRVGLKWPNDLWLLDAPPGAGSGRKLGGVLIESVLDGDGRRAVVIGVGINVRPQAVAEAASGVACLAEIDADAAPLPLLERLAAPLVTALARFDRDGWAAFAERFDQRDVLRGRVVVAGEQAGVAAGVSAQGELLVRGAHGLARVVSGEVRLRTVAQTPC